MKEINIFNDYYITINGVIVKFNSLDSLRAALNETDNKNILLYYNLSSIEYELDGNTKIQNISSEKIEEIKNIKEEIRLNNNKIRILTGELIRLNLKLSTSNNRDYLLNNKLDRKKIILDDVNNSCIVASFSGSNNILNKNVSRLSHIELKKNIKNGCINSTNLEIETNEKNNNRNIYQSLIASTVFVKKDKIVNLLNFADNKSNIHILNILNSLEYKMLFIIKADLEDENILFLNIKQRNDKNIIIFCFNLKNFALFIGNLLHKMPMNSLHNYSNFLNKKEIKRSLFLFIGLKWSDVIKELKLRGVAVSGGNSVKRHILSPMDFNLSLFISKMSNKGYNDIVVSSNLVNKEIYQSIDLNDKTTTESFNIMSKESNTIRNKFNLMLSKEGIIQEINLDIEESSNNKDELIKTSENSNQTKDSHNINLKKNKFNNNVVNNVRKYHTSSNINSNSISNLKDNNRMDFLKNGSHLAYNLKKVLENSKDLNNDKNHIETQIKLENICLEHERNYLDNLMLSLKPKLDTNPLNIKIIRDWELKLKNALNKLTHKYIANNYSNLIIEINKGNSIADFILLILAIETSIIGKEVDKLIENEFNNGKVINILLILIIRMLSSHDNNTEWGKIKQSNLVMNLGNQLVKRAPLKFPVLNLLESKNGSLINEYYNTNILNMSEESKALAGNTLLDLLLDTVDIIERSEPIFDSVEYKRHNYISISNKYRENLIERSFNPLILPMIAKPKAWIKNKDSKGKYVDGGYYTEEMKRIITSDSFLHQNYKNIEKTKVGSIQADTINFINNQEYKINKLMLNYLLSEFKVENSLIFKGFNKLHVLTNNIKDLEQKDIENVLSHNSKYYLNKNILELAIIFENVKFYLPSFMDFRGRIYPYPHYLNYQGVDIARSLIEFAKGCDINDNNIEVIYQYLANTAGKSKLTIKSKIKWAINFIENLNFQGNNLNNLFIDPKVKEIIENNDESGQFLSVLTNLIKVKYNILDLDGNLKFYTPICFDATCSGIQHLSALFADLDLAMKTNVIGNAEEKPQDFYQEVANSINETLSNEKNVKLKNKFSKLIIDRKFMKRPVMTIPYNVGLNTMTKQLVEQGFFNLKWESLDKLKTCFYEVNPDYVKNKEKLYLTSSEMGALSNILHKSVYNIFPTLKFFKNYLDELINVIIKLNKPIIWITPAKLKISLSYKNFKSEQTKSLYSKKRGVSISLPLTTLNSKTIRQSFMPNFIHSMDAANIQLLIKNLILKKNFINLFTIHDCFATTPDHMTLLNKEVKLAFFDLYFNESYINSMHKFFILQIKSYTEIYTEKSEIDEEILNSFILVINEKTGKTEKIYIPNIPNLINFEDKKEIFRTGILNSLYLIN